MTYTITEWSESGMDTTEKVTALNNLETIYDNCSTYMSAMIHAIYTKVEADSRYYRTPAHPSGRSDTGAGCGINASFLCGHSMADIVAGALPHGAIGMWGLGSITGALKECDGSDGSADLRNFFIRGAGAGITPGSTGGQNTIINLTTSFTSPDHTLTDSELPSHNHTWGPDTTNTTSSGSGGATGNWFGTRVDNTRSTNGIANGTKSSHNHPSGTVTIIGYTDEESNYHSGDIDNRPPFIVVKFVQVK